MARHRWGDGSGGVVVVRRALADAERLLAGQVLRLVLVEDVPDVLLHRAARVEVAQTLSQRFGYDVPVLARVPLDERLRAGGDSGQPLVLEDAEAPAAQALVQTAADLTRRGRGLAGMQLGLTPAGR